MRQRDPEFINIINEVSRGTPSQKTISKLEELGRPLDQSKSIKLFSTNDLVDKFNRSCILKESGELFEYKSEEEGDLPKFSNVLAPSRLWLKKMPGYSSEKPFKENC